MRCPKCGSENYQRINGRKPVELEDQTLRCHQCLNCRSKFISRQQALTEDDAANILDELE